MFEMWNKLIHLQLELELKKMDRLREDLIAVKSRCSNLISRLRSICVSIHLNGGKCETQIIQSIDEVYDGDGDERIISIIDDVIMKALTAARHEADALRLQQHTQIAELNNLKEDIERLRFVIEILLLEVVSHYQIKLQKSYAKIFPIDGSSLLKAYYNMLK